MRNEAGLMIIGAGLVGSSAAYYLSQKGWRDIVVIEQGPLFETGGSVSHAPELVFQTNSSKAMCILSQSVACSFTLSSNRTGSPASTR